MDTAIQALIEARDIVAASISQTLTTYEPLTITSSYGAYWWDGEA